MGDGRQARRRSLLRPTAAPGCALQGPRAGRTGGLGQLGHPHPRRSKLLRTLLDEEAGHIVLLYTPSYDPDANRIEWLWADLRDAVTHNHQRETLDEVLADAAQWVDDLTTAAVLRHLGSPGAEQLLAHLEMQDAA